MEPVFRALADPTRRRILQLLHTRQMSAGEIAGRFTLAKPTLSGHLAILRAADLVSADRQGTSIIYRLNLSVLQQALLGFAQVFGIGLAKAPLGRRRLRTGAG